MTLFLEITAGELKGTRAALREGFSIGRKRGTLTIRDSKLSSLHVLVEERKDGSLWLVDAGSSNGIKIDSGRVRELKLEGGVTFTLGRTDFRIINSEEVAEEGAEAPVVEPTVTRDWWHWIQTLAARGKKTTQSALREVQAFEPNLKLKIVRGPQAGTEWTLGYGPRIVGSASVDLTLEDISLPGVCFKLLPERDGIRFKNETEKEVKLNGKWVETELLQNGDTIDIRNTQIQVVIDGSV